MKTTASEIKALQLISMLVLFLLARTCLSIECPDILPANGQMLGDLKVCEFEHHGKYQDFACQDVVSKNKQYRILFKGGQTPVAVLQLGFIENLDMIIWSVDGAGKQQTCSIPIPEELPETASFMGAGICETEDNRSIPCSVFRHKASRQQVIPDYLVIYDEAGNGPRHSSVIHVDKNRDAVPAEFAYQIGLELIKSKCCKQQYICWKLF